jgi:methanethiol S-methyltransferase
MSWPPTFCLVLLLLLWQPWGSQVWNVNGAAAVLLWSFCAAGWLLAITATFAVDHLELTGLRQVGWAGPPDSAATTELQIGGLHAIVRHPLMTGLVLAFWATRTWAPRTFSSLSPRPPTSLSG